jgi:hypothetical protein
MTKEKLANKILRALETNKFNPDRYLGNGGSWYGFYLITNELIWARNLCDGYEIEIYTKKYL